MSVATFPELGVGSSIETRIESDSAGTAPGIDPARQAAQVPEEGSRSSIECTNPVTGITTWIVGGSEDIPFDRKSAETARTRGGQCAEGSADNRSS